MPCAWKASPVVILLGASLSVLVMPTTGLACAVCVGSAPEDYGYFWGVLFLMSMPFTVGGLIGGWLVYGHRRSRSRLANSSAQNLQPPASRQGLLAEQRTTERALPGDHQRGSKSTPGFGRGEKKERSN
jgi:hypothetical protein